MELRMIGRRVSNGAVTLLGDLAQSTGVWEYDSWQSVLEMTRVEGSIDLRELGHGYRIPAEVMEPALNILARVAPTATVPVAYRNGGTLEWLACSEDEIAGITELAAAEARREGGTLAVIGPPGLLPGLEQTLAQGVVGQELGGELTSKVVVIDSATAKGLEFDHVIVVEPGSMVMDEDDLLGYRLLYVAATRSTKSLRVVYSKPLPTAFRPSDYVTQVRTVAPPQPPTEMATPEAMHKEVPSPDATPASGAAYLARDLLLSILRDGVRTDGGIPPSTSVDMADVVALVDAAQRIVQAGLHRRVSGIEVGAGAPASPAPTLLESGLTLDAHRAALFFAHSLGTNDPERIAAALRADWPHVTPTMVALDIESERWRAADRAWRGQKPTGRVTTPPAIPPPPKGLTMPRYIDSDVG
jgi:hypothetical protein